MSAHGMNCAIEGELFNSSVVNSIRSSHRQPDSSGESACSEVEDGFRAHVFSDSLYTAMDFGFKGAIIKLG
jgi:hypothetical protein